MEKECFYEIPGKNYVCTGRIDCLLYDDSAAEFILVDFKTSSAPQPLYYGNPHEPEETEEFELPDFQMPTLPCHFLCQSLPKERWKLLTMHNLGSSNILGVDIMRYIS